jgi:hypothetical protein
LVEGGAAPVEFREVGEVAGASSVLVYGAVGVYPDVARGIDYLRGRRDGGARRRDSEGGGCWCCCNRSGRCCGSRTLYRCPRIERVQYRSPIDPDETVRLGES